MKFPQPTHLILLVGAPPGSEQQAEAERVAHEEKAALTAFLKVELGLELAEAKTLVTPVTTPMRFLGHHVLVRRHPGHKRPVSASLVPKERSQIFRERIKRLFRKPSMTMARKAIDSRAASKPSTSLPLRMSGSFCGTLMYGTRATTCGRSSVRS